MATLITWCDEADAVLGDLTKEGSGVDFAVFSVELPKSKQEPARLVFSSEDHKGQGGRDAVQKCLETSPEDGIRMGCFLVSAIDQEVGATAVSVRSKFVHVLWMGDAVGVMVRGKVQSWYSAAVRQKLPQAAIFVQLKGTDDLDDLQVPALEASLSSAGGAHKPKRYSFTNSTAMGRDAAAMARAAEEAKRQAAEEAQRQAEEEARQKAEDARRKADEAQQKAEAERLAKLQADEEEAQRKAEEETRRQADEEEEARKKKAEEEARRLAAQDKKRRAEEEAARRLAEEEQRRRDEAERQRTKILITKNATLGEGRKLILLISKSSGNFQQTSNTSRLRIMMDGLGLPAEEIDLVDGGEESQKERRNTLFGISALRAQYPQVFLLEADGTTRFVGDFEEIQYLNESGTLGQTLGVTVKTTQKTVTITENVVVEEFVVESAADPTVVVEEEQVVVVETSTEVVTSQPMETLPSPEAEQPTTTEPASIKTEYQEAPQEPSKEGEGEAVPVQEEEEERPLPVDAEPSGPVMESVTTTDIAVEKQQSEAECVAVVPPQAEQEQLEEPLPQDDSLQRTETADDRAEEEATEMGEANEQLQQQQ